MLVGGKDVDLMTTSSVWYSQPRDTSISEVELDLRVDIG